MGLAAEIWTPGLGGAVPEEKSAQDAHEKRSRGSLSSVREAILREVANLLRSRELGIGANLVTSLFFVAEGLVVSQQGQKHEAALLIFFTV